MTSSRTHQGVISLPQGTAAGFPSRHCCHISVIILIKINHQVVQSKDTWDGYFGNDWWGRPTAVVVLSLGILKILLFPVVWCSQHYLFYYLFYVSVVIIICYLFWNNFLSLIFFSNFWFPKPSMLMTKCLCIPWSDNAVMYPTPCPQHSLWQEAWVLSAQPTQTRHELARFCFCLHSLLFSPFWNAGLLILHNDKREKGIIAFVYISWFYVSFWSTTLFSLCQSQKKIIKKTIYIVPPYIYTLEGMTYVNILIYIWKKRL